MTTKSVNITVAARSVGEGDSQITSVAVLKKGTGVKTAVSVASSVAPVLAASVLSVPLGACCAGVIGSLAGGALLGTAKAVKSTYGESRQSTIKRLKREKMNLRKRQEQCL